MMIYGNIQDDSDSGDDDRGIDEVDRGELKHMHNNNPLKFYGRPYIVQTLK